MVSANRFSKRVLWKIGSLKKKITFSQFPADGFKLQQKNHSTHMHWLLPERQTSHGECNIHNFNHICIVILYRYYVRNHKYYSFNKKETSDCINFFILYLLVWHLHSDIFYQRLSCRQSFHNLNRNILHKYNYLRCKSPWR